MHLIKMKSIKVLYFQIHRSWNMYIYLIFNKKNCGLKLHIPQIIFFPRNIFCSEVNSKGL